MFLLSSLCLFGFSFCRIIPSSSYFSPNGQQQVILSNSYPDEPQELMKGGEDSPQDNYYFVKVGCYGENPISNIFSRKESKKMAKAIINEILPISHVAQFTTEQQMEELGGVLYKVLLNPQNLMNVGSHYCRDDFNCMEKFKKVFDRLVEAYYKVSRDLKLMRDIGQQEFVKYYKQLIDNIRVDPSSENTQLNKLVEFILPCRVVETLECAPKPKKLTEEPKEIPPPIYPPPTFETVSSDTESRMLPRPVIEEELEEIQPRIFPAEEQKEEPLRSITPQIIEEMEPINLQERNEENIIDENLPDWGTIEDKQAVETEGDFQDQPPTLPSIEVELVPPLKPISGGVMSLDERIVWLLAFGIVPDISFLSKDPNLSSKIKENFFLFKKINKKYPNCGKGNPIKTLLLWVISQISKGEHHKDHLLIKMQEDEPIVENFMSNIMQIVRHFPLTRIKEYDELKGEQPGRSGGLSYLRYRLLDMAFSCKVLEGTTFSPYMKYLLDDFPKSYGKRELNEWTMRHFIYNMVYLR